MGVIYTKNGINREATSPAQQVQLEADGWAQVQKSSPKAAETKSGKD